VIAEIQGDLLRSDVDALVNTVNCVGVMGKGLALQFKRRYPANFDSYAAACRRGEVQLGRMFVVPTNAISGPQWIINFPTKGHWKAKSRLVDIEAGLDDLIAVIRSLGIRSIAVPPLGAGNGGLDWQRVEPLIRSRLGELEGVSVQLYAPNQGPQAIQGTVVRMTWGRAVLVRLVERYVDRRQSVEPWEDPRGASALEIQKLMYFAHLVQPKLRLTYAPGRYGPYSEQVRHLIQGMEGTYLSGFGDGTSRVLDLQPIAPTDEGREQSTVAVAEKFPEVDTDIVAPVLNVVVGFEGAYGLELLASVHWVAAQEGAVTVESATAAVQKWSERKGRLFTSAHVGKALEHLRSTGVLVA
jgi:O-acetyl-ADP-ribose deacetylase (regulator of RNase III)